MLYLLIEFYLEQPLISHCVLVYFFHTPGCHRLDTKLREGYRQHLIHSALEMLWNTKDSKGHLIEAEPSEWYDKSG